MIQLPDETIEVPQQIALRECWRDHPEFNPKDFSGGNYDDAYSGGYADGEATIAKLVLEAVGLMEG